MPTPVDDQRSALTGASELLRGLGLLVDGPVAWGGRVHSRAPGVFIIELPGGRDEAPIDHASLRQWLARNPDLRLDGEPPTTQTLAARLAAFWLPGEPVLYVGRSPKSIGARVAALYGTPLGDARPFAGAHWLKTLSVLTSLRIWWAETDAHEEYEDALLDEVATRTAPEVAGALPDQGVVLPFANLVAPTGRRKGHGLEHALREPSEAPAEAAPRPAPAGAKTATARRGSAGTARARPAAGARATVRAAKSAERPAAEPNYLSQDGLDRLVVELEQLRADVRPGVIERVKTARELGDLRENSEYESARKEQSFVEGRIQTLEALIRSAVVVDAPVAADRAGVGSTVVVDFDGDEETFVLVGSSEADPARGRISYSSPVGQALVGRRAGEEVTARLPRGEIRMRLREVR